jgi:hypothetical protein
MKAVKKRDIRIVYILENYLKNIDEEDEQDE